MPQPINFLRPDGSVVEVTAWSDADLDEMAFITPDDQQAAEAYWRRHLPRKFRTLLDAVSTARR